MYNLTLIAILEPFVDNTQLYYDRLLLNMDHASCKQNGKIWIFWNNNFTRNIMEADDQHIICELKHVEYTEDFLISFIMPNAKITSEDYCGIYFYTSLV